MDPDVVIGVLERIADLLAPGAQQAWEIAMRQVGVYAMMDTRGAWVSVVLGVIFLGVFICSWAEQSEYGGDHGFGGMFISAIFILACVLVAASLFTKAATYQMNPEYYAIRTLLELAGRQHLKVMRPSNS